MCYRYVLNLGIWFQSITIIALFQDQYLKSMSCFRLGHHPASGRNRKEFLKPDTFPLPQALDSLLLTLVMRGIYSVVGGLNHLRHNHLGWVLLGHAILCESLETSIY